jgi:hypothetical protein
MSKQVAKARVLMISLPALLALTLLLSVGALLIAGYVGRPATGERVTIQVRSACAPAWQERMAQRGEAIGLGKMAFRVAGDTVYLTATLPGNTDDRLTMPDLLVAPGRLSIHIVDGPPVATEADLAEVRLSMSYMGRPTVALRPSELAWEKIRAMPVEVILVATLDGVSVELGELRRVGRDDELHVQPVRETAAEEMQMAADWSILLRTGPAPCEVTQITVTDSADG